MKFILSDIKNKVLVKYPSFGTITANVEYFEDETQETAATDGYNILYNQEFMDTLTEGEQIQTIAHEIMHIAFDHINRAQDKKHDEWNIATDAVINGQLKEDGLPIYKNYIDLPWAKDFNAEDLYEVFVNNPPLFQQIKKAIEEMQKNNNGQGKQGKGQGQGSSGSSHKTWYEKKEKQQGGSGSSGDDADDDKKDGQGQGSGKDKDGKDKKDGQGQGSGDKKDEKDKDKKDGNGSGKETEEEERERRRKKRIQNEQEAFREEGEKKAFQKNKEEKKERLERIREEINNQQVSHQAGNGPSTYLRKLGEIGIQPPLIDWRRVLRDSVTFDLDWSYKHAKIEDNIVKANLEEIPYAEVEIVLDTSGSIDSELLKAFLRETKNIMLNAKVRVGCFDTQFYGFHQIRNEKDINTLDFPGGGGTDFDVAVNAFTRRVQNRIVFTDGYASMPQKPMKVIWVVFGDAKINPKGGKVIYVDQAKLMKKRRI